MLDIKNSFKVYNLAQMINLKHEIDIEKFRFSYIFVALT